MWYCIKTPLGASIVSSYGGWTKAQGYVTDLRRKKLFKKLFKFIFQNLTCSAIKL